MLKSHNKTIFDILDRSPIHPFPARMAPGIALEALGKGNTSLRVLDPMMGSGTVLAVARANGHRAMGTDVDPLAVLMAGVWTRTIDVNRVNEIAEEVLQKAKVLFRSLTYKLAYPRGSNKETQKFIRYWFDEYSRRQLTALSIVIYKIRDNAIRDLLWCGLSRLIITKQAGASRAMDLSHSRPHKAFARAPIKPFNHFLSAVGKVAANCPHKGKDKVGPLADARHGDARKLHIKSSSIDLVLTSPPYLNGIDYLRCSKFSLVWMGHNVDELREIRGGSVGAEVSLEKAIGQKYIEGVIEKMTLRPALSNRHHGLLRRYVWDIHLAMAETTRVLRKGGRAVFVIGDSMTRGTFISNSSIIEQAGRSHGLLLTSRHTRTLPANRRYLPPPKKNASSAAMDGRLRREVVIEFRKP